MILRQHTKVKNSGHKILLFLILPMLNKPYFRFSRVVTDRSSSMSKVIEGKYAI